MTSTNRYLKPAKADRAFNSLARGLTKVGISLLGSRVLTVEGRKSGQPRSIVLNLLKHDGERYLVSPRGHTEWVRNLRVAGEATLSVGSRSETVRPVELADEDKLPVIRAYLKKWGWEVGRFFEGVTVDTPDDELLDLAPGFPVFRLSNSH
ncbi:nitroreductase [Prauserella marina]|uniref:Deazaflavin-dependent oxidoreductase, nitroreductase family n=1 Tax=Prauserella marina TaxID=530584 RepID=A0A222VX67_9PSEU|nr:nitroreductase family deazaflavin-dependent oxidoreductase [Prauserella marina]ASR38504.1 nitroreductase [Prauserella marina]PWV81799.1 deazaflavin-dependent oxidoreductase (nitroreductase family) [Prauserella marina]SDD12571.1 deazaflavin-dependent oxidoreductase, nitroreductase family [Prauserella marina]